MNKSYDIVGIGFGPSNLALAIALQELKVPAAYLPCFAFVEQKETFSWFSEMLFDGARMQSLFLNDLVTLRNPQSYYSFLNYLKIKGRLGSFINLRSCFASRIEFHDYFKWVSDHFYAQTHFGHKVIRIDPIGRDTVNELRIFSKNMTTEKIKTIDTRNIVLALGKRPRTPYCVKASQNSFRIWHSAYFLSRIAHFDKRSKLHFAVLGGGQSSAEICHYLYQNFPLSTLTIIMRGLGFRALDNTGFINETLVSSDGDMPFNISASLRYEILERLRHTSNGAVDSDLIKILYSHHYNDLISGTNRIQIRNLACLKEAHERDERVFLSFADLVSGYSHNLNVDALIMCTGFESIDSSSLLERLMPYFDLNESGDLNIEKNYRIRGHAALRAGIFLQETNKSTHGPSETLLSPLPLRSGKIARAVLNMSMTQNLGNSPEITTAIT